jgi:hypothetical protein
MKATPEHLPTEELPPGHQYILSLTNTSSRIVRQKIFASALSLPQVQPINMIIQEATMHQPPLSYDTTDPSTVMTVLLEAKEKKAHLLHDQQEENGDFLQLPLHQIFMHHRHPHKGTMLEMMLRQPTLHSPLLSTKPTSRPSPLQQKKGPSFASFDHGDHFHYIFCIKHPNNSSRTIANILEFLKIGLAGVAEANATLQRVRSLSKFLAYLLLCPLPSHSFPFINKN